jgi:hypothetical protein
MNVNVHVTSQVSRDRGDLMDVHFPMEDHISLKAKVPPPTQVSVHGDVPKDHYYITWFIR